MVSKKKYNTRNQQKQKMKKGRNDPDTEEEDNVSEDIDEESEYETVSETDSSYEPEPRKKSSKTQIIYSDSESDEESAIDPRELRKTIATLFPSNYMNNKIKSESRKPVKKNNKSFRKKRIVESEEEEEEEEDDEEEEDEEYDDDEEDEDNNLNSDFNIFFSALKGGFNNSADDNDKKAIVDDSDEECNSDDEKLFMKENYETIPIPELKVDTTNKTGTSKDKNNKKFVRRNKSDKSDKSEEIDVESEYKDLVELKKQLSEKLVKRPNNKILLNAITECKNSINKLVKKSRMKNAKKYYKMVNGEDENQTGEIEYFKTQLSNKEQLHVIKELCEINEHNTIKKPYRLTLLDSNIPPKYKATVMQKVNMLRSMEPGDPEYFKLKTWVDGFMRIPFGKYKTLDVSISDGIDKCSEFMENAKNTLDECVYGLTDAKMQIMQMIGQWITNPNALGTAIAIKGPPGTGKTSLVKEGISKILGREFAFIALGGTGDASFLEGHGYTYEGSMWGRIVQILMDSKSMNPVIYFDELDKVSDTPRGEEIIGILTHLTDSSQNNQYHDKYFSEISFDLSKCLFIFSYNDESKINPILRDRMYRIMTKGYEANEKLVIARDFLLPKIREQVAYKTDELIIPDEIINEIINNKNLTMGEEGVRNLKRCLEIIHTKLNLFRLMKPEKNIFAKDLNLQITFPLTVTSEHVKKLIECGQPNQSFLAMYV